MERRASSEIPEPGASTPTAPSAPERSRRAKVGAIAFLVALAALCATMLTTSPIFAIGGSPLVFGALDATTARALGTPSPSPRLRLLARATAAGAWGSSIAMVAATHGRGGSFRLPLLAIALTIGTIVGTWGSAGRRGHAPIAEAPLIGAVDVATAGFAFVAALGAHDRGALLHAVGAAGVALALLLRALLVATIVRRTNDAGSSVLAAIGFVSWVASGAVACTLAATPVAWSGLGASVVLTVAAIVVELRRRRAIVVFLRGSLAFAFATMLGVATLLAT